MFRKIYHDDDKKSFQNITIWGLILIGLFFLSLINTCSVDSYNQGVDANKEKRDSTSASLIIKLDTVVNTIDTVVSKINKTSNSIVIENNKIADRNEKILYSSNQILDKIEAVEKRIKNSELDLPSYYNFEGSFNKY